MWYRCGSSLSPVVPLSPVFPQCIGLSLCLTYLESQHLLLYYLNAPEVNPAWILCHILTIVILIAVPAGGVFLDIGVGHRIHNEPKFWFLAFERMSASLPAARDGSVCEVCAFISLYLLFLDTIYIYMYFPEWSWNGMSGVQSNSFSLLRDVTKNKGAVC